MDGLSSSSGRKRTLPIQEKLFCSPPEHSDASKGAKNVEDEVARIDTGLKARGGVDNHLSVKQDSYAPCQ